MAILKDAVRSWLGIKPYEPRPQSSTLEIDTESVDATRRMRGGQLENQPITRSRWYLADLETAEHQADGGRLELAAQLMRAAKRDGVIYGVMSTRTDGLVRLPKRFSGDAEIVNELQPSAGQPRSTFDEMCPPTELGALAADAEFLGVGVGELVPVEGREFPLLVRHDPEFLVYVWNENQWYFRAITGLIKITPGDGRWVLHRRGPLQAPWQFGLWKAVGQAYIRKQHASFYKDSWEAKLANPARVATAPGSASDNQRQEWFRAVAAWGVNTVFQMLPGYEVKLVESNGRGWESFSKTKAECNEDITIAIAGQTVTTDGGAGFQNSDIHKTIRADLIKATADALAHTVNTQILPQYIAVIWGSDDGSRSVVIEWDVTPPKDRSAESQSLISIGTAITTLDEALAAHGLELDVTAIATRFGIPIKGDTNGDGIPDTDTGEKPSLRLVENDNDEKQAEAV